MTDYLTDMCKLVIEKTSLLPHVNAGTLNEYEIVKLKNVCASMGMMLETTSKRLTKKEVLIMHVPIKFQSKE